jgi:tocopherol cyclase
MRNFKDIGFHGHQRKNFFEGWYYKLVLEEAKLTLALIPGVSNDEKDPHSFIQVFVSPHMIFKYIRFDHKDFIVQEHPFEVRIKDNLFSLTQVLFNFEDEDLKLNLDCTIEDITPIKSSLLSPTIMGPFHYLPRMQCNHGIVSMNHTLHGHISFNHQTTTFHNHKGYIEKDWGTSFPRKYVWCQSNHFTSPRVSVFLSIATIPMLLFEFEGLIANITINDQEYRFATYTNAKFKIETIDDFTRIITLTQKDLKAVFNIHSPTSIALVSPKQGSMSDMIKEGLEGTIELSLYKNNKLIFKEIGIHSGVEFSGY